MTQPLKYIIESLLFVSEEPVSLQQFKSVLEDLETAAIREALSELAAEYDARGGGFELQEVAGGYQLRTRAAYSAWVKKLLKPSPTRLSRAALETLAIIAYKQPIIRADVEHIRGVDCGGVLRMLLEKKLIRVLGRKDIPGRPMIYGTTRQFLEVFNLKDLRDLPSPKEIESLGLEEELEYPDPEEGADAGARAEDNSKAESAEPSAGESPDAAAAEDQTQGSFPSPSLVPKPPAEPSNAESERRVPSEDGDPSTANRYPESTDGASEGSAGDGKKS